MLPSSRHYSSNTKAAPKKAPGNLIPGREETLRMGRNTQRVGAVRGLTFPPNKAVLSRWAGACELSSRSVSMHRDRDAQTRNYHGSEADTSLFHISIFSNVKQVNTIDVSKCLTSVLSFLLMTINTC